MAPCIQFSNDLGAHPLSTFFLFKREPYHAFLLLFRFQFSFLSYFGLGLLGYRIAESYTQWVLSVRMGITSDSKNGFLETKVQKASPAIGAYVDVDLSQVNLGNWLRDLLHNYELLVFRNQHLSMDRFLSVAQLFGCVEPHPAYPTVADTPEVQILESTPEKPSKIELWHSDMTFRVKPPSTTLLYADTLPEIGGDTLWTSTTTAFETLSEPLRSFVSGLQAEHDFAYGFRESLEEPGGRERLASVLGDNPPTLHPVIRRHPVTGRSAIFVNPLFTRRIANLSRNEGRVVLQILNEHIVKDEHTFRLKWFPRTLVIWDNRSTQHKPINDFMGHHRKMFRITLQDDALAE